MILESARFLLTMRVTLSRLLLSAVLHACSLSFPSVALAHAGGVDLCGCHTDSSSGVHHCHPQRAKQSCEPRITFTSERPPKAGDEGVLSGPFVSIIDGDSFKVKVQGAVMEVRLQGIDTPEHDQPFGNEARGILESIIDGEHLVLVFDDVDRYGRIVASVWVANLDVNREMIRRGAAWFDSHYARDPSLYDDEQDAREAKRGLWALPLEHRIEPWVWRRQRAK